MRRDAGVVGQVQRGADEIHLRRQRHLDVVNRRGEIAARDRVGERTLQIAERELHRLRARGHGHGLDVARLADELRHRQSRGPRAHDPHAHRHRAAGRGPHIARLDRQRRAIQRRDARERLEQTRRGIGELLALEKVKPHAHRNRQPRDAEPNRGGPDVRRLTQRNPLQRRVIFAEQRQPVFAAAARARVARDLQAVDQLIARPRRLPLDGQRHLILRQPHRAPAPPNPAQQPGHDEKKYRARRHAPPARQMHENIQREHDPQITERRGDQHREEFEHDQPLPLPRVPRH